MNRKWDWEAIAEEYVQGDDDLTLDVLARKHGINRSLMRRWSGKANWVDQRKQYRRLIATKSRELASTAEAEIRSRHIQTAKLMMSLGQMRLARLAKKLSENPEEIDKLDIFESRMLIAVGAEIERRAAGIPDTSEIDIKHLEQLSDDELLAIAEGKSSGALASSKTGS